MYRSWCLRVALSLWVVLFAFLHSEAHAQEGRLDDPHSTRLLFAPTAQPLGAGRGYVALHEFFVPSISIGVHEKVSVAGGAAIFPDAGDMPLYGASTWTVLDGETGALAVGMMAGTTLGTYGGLIYGVGTVGSARRSLTVGAGWGAVGRESGSPVLLIGGTYRIGGGLKLIGEGYFAPGVRVGPDDRFESVVGAGGVRFYGRRLSVDVGMVLNAYAVPRLPWLGVHYAFGW